MHATIDPRRFGPLAEHTPWTPIAEDAIPFVGCELYAPSAQRLVVRKDRTQRTFGLVVMCMAAVPLLLGAALVASNEMPLVGAVVVVGGVAGVWAGRRWRSVHTTVVLDQGLQLLHHGDGDLAFADIVALQILEKTYGTERRFTSYELNVVARDGGRRNLLDHGDVVALRADADLARALLACPIWDATSGAPS